MQKLKQEVGNVLQWSYTQPVSKANYNFREYT